MELKTPPHYKFNQLKNNISSFASCFVSNPNDINLYRPISTTQINHNDNIFRSPNDLKKKIVTIETKSNPNTIENIKIKESSSNAISQKQPKIVCNCKKSKCLKLYCECFILGLYCDGCNCSPCFNNVANAEERNRIMASLKDKNPAAFKPKIDYNLDDEKNKVEKTKHIRGCNCSKTQCQKKYCECYQSGVLCTELCKCTDCKNDDIEKLKKKVKNNVIFKTVSTNEPQDVEGSLGMNNCITDKNSFSQEFFTSKDYLKDLKTIERKCTHNKHNEDEEDEASDEKDSEECEKSHYKHDKSKEIKSSNLTRRKRKRTESDEISNSEIQEAIITPKFGKSSGKKTTSSLDLQNASTGPRTNKKRITKINEDEDNKISKKLNLN